MGMHQISCLYFPFIFAFQPFANIFANELFTTIKTKSDLAVQIEAKSPIKR